MVALVDATKAQLLAAIAKADKESSRLTDAMIEAGRGRETFSDVRGKTDPLSRQYLAAADRQQELRFESDRRMTYHGKLTPIKRKDNPMPAVKKPTPAQLAARKAFAAAAKAGTLAKGKSTLGKSSTTKRPTVKSKIDARKAQAKSINPKATHVYVIETSKNKKAWTFAGVSLGPQAGKDFAERMAEDYPALYVRVTESPIEK